MRNIKITIAYDGSGYKGWQLQKNGNTEQAELEKAVHKVFGKAHGVHGAGRTDAGVHARAQTAHFKVAALVPISKIPAALNAYLPEDIVVTSAEEVSQDFHSRFNARGKHYRYYVMNTRLDDPFVGRYAWRVQYKLNAALMNREASALVGRHDFKSFQASDKRERTSVRRITRILVKREKDLIRIDVEGDGFLYNMVRNIAGTLVDIGRGHLPPGSMREILKKRDRTAAGPTAPAKGLFLVSVGY